MNVLAVVRLYPPGGAAGAEWMLHEVMLALQASGDRCFVDAQVDPGTDVFEGVTLYPVDDPDVVVTQIDGAPRAKAIAKAAGVPLVHIAHHHRQGGHHPDLQVANSQHVARDLAKYGPVLVCRPHTPASRYGGRSTREWVTLLNRGAGKGARVFYQLAREHPDKRFVAVTGVWDNQVPPPSLPNLSVHDTVRDANSVYRHTRVLYMGSQDETWGRVSLEAAHRGIPSIVTDCEGTQEALADAGLYFHFGDTACASQLLSCLDDPDEYAYHSRLARHRAKLVEELTRSDLDRLVSAIHRLV